MRKREFLNSDTFCITWKQALRTLKLCVHYWKWYSCKPLKGKDMLSGHVFGVWQFFICNVYFHASWPLTRRVQPDRIPVVCFEIVGLFDHESPLVVSLLKTLENSLDSDQDRNFDKVSKCLKLWRLYIPGPRHKRSWHKSLQITNTAKYHSACRVDTQASWHNKYWVCDQVRDNPVCSATETTLWYRNFAWGRFICFNFNRQIRWFWHNHSLICAFVVC